MVSLSHRWLICSAQSVQQATNVTPIPPWDIVRARRRRPSAFIWRTTEVTIKPLFQVDKAFGWDEGGPHARLVARCPSLIFRSASDALRLRDRRRYPHRIRAIRGRVAA